ncbi:hypothetical protein CONPUDRAFT_156604 [Coniophora puteana RWD-64-598 SS2]|uniref:Uncharacterized protein n=1 Tax=Coniophora puteana (strain RWD-64-598) TaxID=741705 RepID=A0A5M3MHD4_CONPW|nr:uncharacterized protein CONPUDRAFT_156604 [Coniophora puteana RWD-64-598 SS2]EIW78638.1 hypothetical protein CONPUDRAFT_156604 [Coniophora puteana RWD-64-598 SS2]
MLSIVITFVFDLLCRCFTCFSPPPEEGTLPAPVSSRQLRSALRESADWGPYQSIFHPSSHKSLHSASASSCESQNDQSYEHGRCDSRELATPPTSPPLQTPPLRLSLPRYEEESGSFWSLRRSATSTRIGEMLSPSPSRSPRKLLKSLSLPRLSPKLATQPFRVHNASQAVDGAGGMFSLPFPIKAEIAVHVDVHVASEARAVDEEVRSKSPDNDSDNDVLQTPIDSFSPSSALEHSNDRAGSSLYVARLGTCHLSVTTIERNEEQDIEMEIMAVSKEFSGWRVEDLSDGESDVDTSESVEPYYSVV